MDWYPLINSVRIALISTVIVFFLGVWLANAVVRAPRVVKGALDVILTLPLVLPPTVVGYLLLLLLGPKRPLGMLAAQLLNLKLTMVWYAAIFATVVVSFPLMYRTARGAFESFDQTLADAALTLGHSERWAFWRVKMPSCAQGIMAGAVLAFARALGEYGATAMICGYTPGFTATVSTTVYQLWRTGDDAGALTWVLVNLAISALVLLAMNLLESRSGRARVRGARA
jgi:molybdate transport system permease protein